jgi:pimeloyl-ACP methyl ester carboxylesterase
MAFVGSCSSSSDDGSSGTTTRGTAATQPGPPTFEEAACPATPEPIPELDTARCGYLLVPENRTEADSRTIRLAVAILPATSPDPAPDPVVFLSGGPGTSAILDASLLVDAGVNRDREVILMDQRGTLHSEPNLLCPEIDAFYARAVSLGNASDERRDQHVEAARECRQRLVDDGVDLTAYNTTENAADFADLRTALGIDEWNLYGYSYGTDLALTIVRDHPEGVRSVVIDGVVPPSQLSLGWTWSSAHEGITNLFAACEAQPECQARYPGISARFDALVQQLEAAPLTVTTTLPDSDQPVTVFLDGGNLVNALVGSLRPFTEVPAMIDALANGNPDPVIEILAAGAQPSPSVMSHAMTLSVFCREMVPFGSPEDLLEKGKQVFPSYPDSVLSLAPQLAFETELCEVWDVPEAPDSQRAATTSDIPALVLNGTFDAKTGAQWGDYAAETLTNATVVDIPGVGHWTVPQNECAAQVVQSFLQDPNEPDTACVAALTPPSFTVD